MLPALLHALAFGISLFVQSMSTPLAGAWLFFHLSGCALQRYRDDRSAPKGLVWSACLCWAITIAASAFLFTPVMGAATTMWILIAMPSLALCVRKQDLGYYACTFGFVILCYALGLITQMVLHVHYTLFDYDGRYGWPLVDPNNAAAVINTALIPCLWFWLNHKGARVHFWDVLLLVFGAALFATGSKAGMACAGICGSILAVDRYGSKLFLAGILSVPALAALVIVCRPDLILLFVQSFADRLPIWEGSWPLLWVRPWLGLGLGTFGHYYAQSRVETYTAGWHSHNDLLQMAIEMGIPAAGVFVCLAIAVLLKTRRQNIVPAVVMLGVFLQSMVEFQFYIPPVSLLMGLALGYFINTRKASPCGSFSRSCYSSLR
jgi:O-antigen ligase